MLNVIKNKPIINAVVIGIFILGGVIEIAQLGYAAGIWLRSF